MRRVAGLKLSAEGHQKLVEQILSDETYALRVRRESEGLTVEAAADGAVTERLGSDPVFFSTLILGLQHAPYQKEFLNTTSKRVVLRWPRQSGKSRSLAAYSIWFAAAHPATNTLIVAPSWRQSSNLHGTIQGLLDASPRKIRRALLAKRTRTITQFRNGSRIIALPNSANLLRGYTTSLIILDEAAFFNNDEDMFLNVLPPMLATTSGTMIVASTPWGRNTQFYRINNDPSWQILHVTWKEPAEAGIYTSEWVQEVEKIRETYPMTYQMEYEAEFTEDVDTWLTQDLLAKSCDLNVSYKDFGDDAKGEFYAGLDLAEVVDYSALAVVRRNGRQLDLIHMHRFPLKEPLVSVLGYVNILCQKWKSIGAVYVDNTKHGKYILHDMNQVGIPNPVGVNFSTDSKQEMAQIMRDRLADGKLRMPYDRSLLNELNVEQYQLTKTGKIAFSHLSGTHDDRFWALALATYAATKEVLPQRPIARSA
jgi:phage terminase large subunit-like protein